MFLLIYITVNIKTVLSHVARLQAWRRLRHWSMPSSITLCYTPTHASNRSRLRSFCAFCHRLASTDFLMKCIEARAVRWPEVWKFYGSLTLVHIRIGGSEWCTEFQRRHSQQNV